MAVLLSWRHPDRREVEIALYVSLRMMHLRGWRRIVVCVERRGAVRLAIELAETATEEDARDWSSLFHKRYRTDTTIAELLADAASYAAVFIDGGVGEFLNSYEAEARRLDELRQRARHGWR